MERCVGSGLIREEMAVMDTTESMEDERSILCRVRACLTEIGVFG